MEKKDIVKNNILIADFMGYEYVPKDERKRSGYWKKSLDNNTLLGAIALTTNSSIFFLGKHHRDILYYNSWDWLMRTIEKIETLGYRFQIGTKYVFVWYEGRQEYLCENYDGKLKTTYHAVIKFIEWYNKQ